MQKHVAVNNRDKHEEIAEILAFIDTLEKFANWRVRTSYEGDDRNRAHIQCDHVALGVVPKFLGNGHKISQVAADLQNAVVKILDPIAMECRKRVEDLSKSGMLGVNKSPAE